MFTMFNLTPQLYILSLLREYFGHRLVVRCFCFCACASSLKASSYWSVPPLRSSSSSWSKGECGLESFVSSSKRYHNWLFFVGEGGWRFWWSLRASVHQVRIWMLFVLSSVMLNSLRMLVLECSFVGTADSTSIAVADHGFPNSRGIMLLST